MEKKQKANLANRLATCSLVVGGLAVGLPAQAEAANIFDYESLGTGSELRAQLLPSGSDLIREHDKEGEEKCGEGKCGEGSCGDDHDHDH